MTTPKETLILSIPRFSFYDLYKPEKLAELTRVFYEEVREKDGALFERFAKYRDAKGAGFSDLEESHILVEMTPHLSGFIEKLFGVEDECKEFRLRATKDAVIFRFKKDFFIRRALKNVPEAASAMLNGLELDSQFSSLRRTFNGIPSGDEELAVASMVMEVVDNEKGFATRAQDATAYFGAMADALATDATWRSSVPGDRSETAMRTFALSLFAFYEKWLAFHYYQKSAEFLNWVSFKVPKKVEFENLVDRVIFNDYVPNVTMGHEVEYRRRDGFDLTDHRYDERQAMSEVDYCVICHERGKDSCSKGFPDPQHGFKKNPLGYPLKGCPLDQKISESHVLKGVGDNIGALAIITIDNPLCAGTGHRICNDCMKACIYQKQEPVNIPQAETRTLVDVLELPWGFEIYSLLTRWNPLKVARTQALPYNGKNVLVVGLGPAGYSLSHYLLNEGFAVVGIDGLKIEPLHPELAGVNGEDFSPIRDISYLTNRLSERVLQGFGGVSEYGITVRWDKNFLTVLYINLMRRSHFRICDGVRFGSTITVEDAWELGFDHIALASGAGKPTFVSMKNNLIRGIRKASDFLMALQLTGAGKKDSIANLQIQLPALVIGGGLTAIDTATELMAYYPVQVEKIKLRYDSLCATKGKEKTDAMFDKEEKGILEKFLAHAEEIHRERERAHASGEKPNFIPLVRKWGGVRIYYRKSLNDAPAYRLNHEEIIKALEEGIYFVEKMSPLEAVPDEFGALKEMVFERMEVVSGKWKSSGETFRVPARALMVAAGTVPNIMYEKEYPSTFQLDDRQEFFKGFAARVNGKVDLVAPEGADPGFFTSYLNNGKTVSYYGDNHPVYEGNVVKAMASAKAGYKKVLELFPDSGKPATSENVARWQLLSKTLDNDFRPHVIRVDRLTPTIVEVILHAPAAAKRFLPGQFFRLQNYEVDSPKLEGTLLTMEGIALTGAWVDKEKGLLSLIVLEMGSSSNLCKYLKPNQRVVVMGPTGTPTEIDENSTVLLLGGGLGNAVLFSIAKAFKEKHNRVIYFAGYKKKADLFKQEEIEAATDVVVYSVDAGEPIVPRRPQDKSFVGNIVQAIVAYSTGQLGDVPIPTTEAERVIAIGSDRMMAAVAASRHTALKPYLKENHMAIASINSLMQCMMKAICAQCLQRHVNKETGKEEFVFTCVNQDQCMDDVDFQNLNARLKTNTVMEKLSREWVNLITNKHEMAGV